VSAATHDALPPEEAYRLWAAAYDSENAVTALDQLLVGDLTPPLAGKRLLDAACGTGRRLVGHQGAWAIGADRAREMLRVGRRRSPESLRLINADVQHLPVLPGTFDVVWCRLALSHVPDLPGAYREFFRITNPGAWLIVSDFHPAAQRAGHRRTFRDPSGALHAVEYEAHSPATHATAARAAGFSPDSVRELGVGPDVRAFYAAAGMLDRYQEEIGLPLVFAWRFVRGETCRTC
jgi:malonyl-CoA O-methyltransferase